VQARHAATIQRVARVAWLLAPLALVALPTRWLAAMPGVCVIRRVTGQPCPGCGMTRALSRLAHGDLCGAWRHNPRVVVVAPLLVVAWLGAIRKEPPLQ
jgi:hypothetical protein